MLFNFHIEKNSLTSPATTQTPYIPFERRINILILESRTQIKGGSTMARPKKEKAVKKEEQKAPEEQTVEEVEEEFN